MKRALIRGNAGCFLLLLPLFFLGVGWSEPSPPSVVRADEPNLRMSNRISLQAYDEVSAFGSMVLIPEGEFVMGDATGVGSADELPVHTVHVSAFYLAKHEVTKELWDEVRDWGLANGYTDLVVGNGSYASKGANHPVHTINWYEAVKWCNARSEKEGFTACYTVAGSIYRTGNSADVSCNWKANGYRLPTEAEWEKAARGGQAGRNFSWGDTISHNEANYYSSYSYAYDMVLTGGYHPTYKVGDYPYSSPVGSFPPNGYGLHDMAGNMWEWCWDWYEEYSATPQVDPRGPTSGSPTGPGRVRRSGSWNHYAHMCRVSDRYSGLVGTDYRIGFRPARGYGLDAGDAPVLLSLAINEGAVDTASATVTLGHEREGGEPAEYRASEDEEFAGAEWQVYETAPEFTLGGTGARTVYLQLRNEDGESAVVSDSIMHVASSPTAHSAAVATKEDRGVDVVLRGSVAGNASLTFRVTKRPKHGKLTGKVPNLRYVPKTDFNGSDSVQFVVSDGQRTSAPGTIQIKVKPVNDRPVAKAIKRNVVQGKKDVFVLKASDVDTPQKKLRFQVVNKPKEGRLTWERNGKCSYLAPRKFTGLVRFSYFATDGKLKSKKKTVVLVVKAWKKG